MVDGGEPWNVCETNPLGRDCPMVVGQPLTIRHSRVVDSGPIPTIIWSDTNKVSGDCCLFVAFSKA